MILKKYLIKCCWKICRIFRRGEHKSRLSEEFNTTMLRLITMKGSHTRFVPISRQCVFPARISVFGWKHRDNNTQVRRRSPTLWSHLLNSSLPVLRDDKSQILTASAWDSWVWVLVPGIHWSQAKWSSNLCLDLRMATQKYICVPATPVCNVSRWSGWNLSAQN